ncbi:hypothetical protein B857_01012 [Solibacillus isronensis B3W22]|uniref:DUF1934 domain-containing protein n=2 Tax=Solibacillus TaxID=648800 RepID=F2F779_SOLSS|nr:MULTISPECIES: DUF1934 domain-containing protein [Solibacillus]AMO84252.1 hypothetical protein SOLI23_01355 [Solibacillus silvestris]EKB46118.1 hypothetical protein B857_01012 [Solibacillus isronensis B3W22]OBW58934.1 hypothetical protein A9986_08285 [Solibacillus silvestris]BAK17838.1 uncharacterized protein SSIL_3415 [Solibacillus silvestris StLB046]
MANESGKTVKIKLVSSIIPTEGELEQYEMWLEGSCVEKGNSHYLRYEEVQEDLQIQTTIKLNEANSFIMRKGGVNMRLPLNPDLRENGHYESPFGSLPLVTDTHQLAIEVVQSEKVSGQFKTHYDLIIGGNSVGHYKLDIQFTEV